MKANEIDTYAELMQKWDLSRLSVTEEGAVIRLERSSSKEKAPEEAIETAKGHALPGMDKRKEEIPAGVSAVRSPMVGVFYAAPAENADPFVAVGDRIRKGQTLCIIEAMKLMNEIRAEADGTIEKICVTNGQVVEFGTELFRVAEEAV